MILKLHHAEVIIRRGQEDLARRFYCELLGLKEIPKPANLSKNGGLWLELGANQIHLSIDDGFDPAQTKAHLAYQVHDLAALLSRLEAAGFQTKMNEAITGYTRANVRDPFGNRIEFMQAN